MCGACGPEATIAEPLGAQLTYHTLDNPCSKLTIRLCSPDRSCRPQTRNLLKPTPRISGQVAEGLKQAGACGNEACLFYKTLPREIAPWLVYAIACSSLPQNPELRHQSLLSGDCSIMCVV